jgi:PAS domain-containing protein
MIGQARRTGVALRARNVRPPRPKPQHWKSPHNYIRNNKAQASAMCVPVMLGREVEWVLDCESTQVDGFMQPDEDAIVALVGEIERTIRLWFESRLNNALLNRVDQGVIVVNEHHRIERLNSAASRLLGCDMAVGLPLAGFVRDEAAQKLLGSRINLPASGVQLTLRGADGRDRFVLASAREPEDTFHRRIWLFSDLADSQWIADLSHVRQTVQDVAAQTRGPLLLANALVRQARHLVSNSDAGRLAYDVLERATRSLNKTDITYERLASSLEAISEPQRKTRLAPFSVASALTILRHTLPAEDDAALKLNVPDNLPAIRADAERMAFALRSIIGYLLSVRAPNAQVAFRAWTAHSGGISLRASLEAGSAPIEPALTQASSSDQAHYVGQVLTAARTIVESHGGRLLCRATVDGLEVNVEDLPSSTVLGVPLS